jgi:hypothetical protein
MNQSVASKSRSVALLSLRLFGVGLGLLAGAHAATFITIDVPGATGGTVAQSINSGGAITGYSVDASGVSHGFLRSAGGTITSFDVPGAGTASGQGTAGTSINTTGSITGYYVDAGGVHHGFLRAPDGTFTAPIDSPDSATGTSSGEGTDPTAISDAGVIAGSYALNFGFYGYNTRRGFVRSASGTITTFSNPSGYDYTLPTTINTGGATTGFYLACCYPNHGFLRAPDGTFTTFDVPGAGTNGLYYQGTIALGINDGGAIAGYYRDPSYVNTIPGQHGFLRAPDGTISTFDVAGAQSTFATRINSAGTIMGFYIDGSTVYHGFLRNTAGTITSFNAPDAGTASGQGTVGTSINSTESIAGYYVDSSGVNHGFLRTTVTAPSQYQFIGFLSPITNGVLNQVKAGQSVPVKWQLKDSSGNFVTALSSVTAIASADLACGTEALGAAVPTTTSGSSSLRYDSSANQFVYTWQTASSWADTCRRLSLSLDDGSTHTVDFKLK